MTIPETQRNTPADPRGSVAEDAPQRTGLAMIVIMAGVLMTAVDTTIVVLALPEIQHNLHVGLANVIWVIISFLLVITLLATQVGRLGDMFGRVRMYETGFAVFVIGSFLCALAWDEVSARIARRTGLPQADVHALMEAIPPHLAPMPDSVAWLTRLHDEGARLHFLSNMPRPYAEFLTREHAFLQRFQSGVFSCDVGQIKPNADIFETAALRFDAAHDEIVFIDDNPHNIDAALALGWRAVRFVDAAQCRAELADKGWL